MSELQPVAAIDLGSSRITTVVGEANEHGALQILGVGLAPSAGVDRGQINHVADATRAISASVEQAERSSGRQILSASVAITGPHLESRNNRGVVAIPDIDIQIADEDMQRVIDAGRAVTLDSSRTILHAIPRFYVVDGQDRVADPRGMHGQRLDVEMHLVTASRGAVQNAVQCVVSAGVDVELVAAQPVVGSQYVLRREEAIEGAAVVDLGAGATDIAAYIDGAIAFTASLPIGGAFVTRDLMVGLRAPAEVAEAAKLNFGHALPEMVADQPVSLDGFSEQRDREISHRLIAEIVHARVAEICAMVLKTLKRAKLDGQLNGGIVLYGGGSELPGIVELFESASQSPTRAAEPGELYGLSEQVSNSAAVSTLGLLRWAADAGESSAAPRRAQQRRGGGGDGGGGLASLMRGALNFGRVFLPS